MDPQDLQRLVTQTMPYGKYKDRLIAICPVTISRGSRVRVFQRASSASCSR